MTRKSGATTYESRDTSTPAMIGQLLMALLEANGRKHHPKLTRKRIHDEVYWCKGAQAPWRRSSSWLVLRVCIQRSLCALFGPPGPVQYKIFMCYLLTSLCQDFYSQKSFSADQLTFAKAKLARRMAKLRFEMDNNPEPVASIVKVVIQKHETHVKNVLRLVNEKLGVDWSTARSQSIKRISKLPKKAHPKHTYM